MKLRIKEVCKTKETSITELAQRMDIKQESLSRTINGNPTLSTLENIANALGVEVTELFSEKGAFTALIDNGGTLHRFDSIEALKGFILSIEKE